MLADAQKMRIYRLGISLFFCSVAFAHPAFSQSDVWRSIPVPNTIVATCLTTDSDGAIFVGTYDGIYRSTNGGLDWTSIVATFPGYSGPCNAILRASDDAIWAANGLLICKTTDKGDNWQVVHHPVGSDFYFAALESGEHFGIFLSAGFSWSNWSENFRSTDGGATWSGISLDGYMPSTFVEHNELILTSGYMGSGDRYVAGYNAVKLSTDGGVSWNGILGHFEQDFPGIEIDQHGAFYVSKTDWSAGKGGVFRSTTSGASWQLQDCGRGTATVRCFAVTPDSQVFAGSPTGIYRIPVASAPYTWIPADNGIADSNVIFLHMGITGDLYALTASGHMYAIRPAMMSRPSRMACNPPSAVPMLAAPEVPFISQNYPNPFNPTTSIEYTIEGVRGQESGFSVVRLVVYDLLGREVAVLVNERKAPGTYSVQFDASGLASGMYFYRLTAGNFVETRKMAVVR